MTRLLHVQLRIDNELYETTDTPEAVGPWIARMWDLVRPGPATMFDVKIVSGFDVGR